MAITTVNIPKNLNKNLRPRLPVILPKLKNRAMGKQAIANNNAIVFILFLF